MIHQRNEIEIDTSSRVLLTRRRKKTPRQRWQQGPPGQLRRNQLAAEGSRQIRSTWAGVLDSRHRSPCCGDGWIQAECSPDRVLTDSVHLFRRRTALLVSRSASRHSARILPSPASRAVSSVQNTRASGQDLTGSLCGELIALELLRRIWLPSWNQL